jgi:hypothetical protein
MFSERFEAHDCKALDHSSQMQRLAAFASTTVKSLHKDRNVFLALPCVICRILYDEVESSVQSGE